MYFIVKKIEKKTERSDLLGDILFDKKYLNQKADTKKSHRTVIAY